MEMTIHPHVIKGLMERQKLTQQALADKAGLGIATIKRICSGKDMAKGQRRHTLSALAKALRVEEEALTADTLPPSEEGVHLRSRVHLKASVSRQTDLSFQAVEAIYGISRSAQIAMAPLFTALIAEASLKWRKDRLAAVSLIADQLDAIRGDNAMLLGAVVRASEAEKIEKQSIAEKDVLGKKALERLLEECENALTDLDFRYELTWPDQSVSPLLMFLKDFSESFGKTAIKIELSDEDGNEQMPTGVADYSVGADLIDEICGEYSSWARIAVEYGHVSLSDIPKSLLSPEKAEARKAFIASQMTDAKRWEHAKTRIELYDADSELRRALNPGMFEDEESELEEDSERPVWSLDQRIKHWIKVTDERR